MIRFALPLCLLLGACNQGQTAVDNTAREGAKNVVIETLATRFPQVPKELITPFTDCIIDNATAGEIRDIAKAGLVGIDESTAGIITNVLSRPETVSCLRDKSLSAGIS